VLIHYNASSICVKFSFQISGPCTYNSLCMSWNSAPLASTPVWARDFASPEELVKEFNRECRIVQKGLEGDIKKAVKDGKPVIIEVLISRQFNNLVLSLLSMCQNPCGHM
jgi:hypothetical protein